MSNYLYNGIELPELPSEANYPYWYIELAVLPYLEGKTVYVLINSQYPLYKVAKDGNSFLYTQKSFNVHYTHNITDGVWVKTSNVAASGSSNTPVVWSNFNIYYGDTAEDVGGTLYLAASDPVPVLTNQGLYRKINGQVVKHDVYRVVDSNLVKVDEYNT